MQQMSTVDKNVQKVVDKNVHTTSKDEYFKINNNTIARARTRKGGDSEEENENTVIEKSMLSEKVKSVLKEWIEYKKRQHNFRYKTISLKTLINNILEKERLCGAEKVCAIMRESISNGYKGIVWEKMESQTKKTNKSYTSEELNATAYGLTYEDL